MKASIIIPAYNEEKWIEKTLVAANNQDFQDYEIIVVNNASTDNTAKIVSSFAEKNNKVHLIEETRKGLLFAREAGRKAAKGEILVQLDADCLPKPTWLETGISFFENPKVVSVSGPYHFYDAAPALRITTDIAQKFIYAPASLTTNALGRGAMFVGGNAFIRMSALEEIGGYDTSIDFYSEDADTGIRLSKIGKMIYTQKVTIDSSARRFKAFGLAELNKKYTKAWLAVISGNKFKDNTETVHPR